MFLKSVDIVNFRNYSDLNLELGPNINIIYGENAQGKTNLLESIYFLALTKSHRSFIDDNLIKEGEKIAKISAVLSNNDIDRTLKIVLSSASKKMFIDDFNHVVSLPKYVTNLIIPY